LGSELGPVKIRYCYEQSNSDNDKRGALGAVAHVVNTFGVPGECIVIGSDNFIYGLDLAALASFHRDKKAHATLALYQLANRSDVEHYGITVMDELGRINQFQEKPKVEHALSQLASTAVYYLRDSFLREHLPLYIASQEKAGKRADRLGDVWQHYVRELPLFGFTFNGVWGDTNNAQTYIETNKLAMNFLPTDNGGLPSGGTAPSGSHPKFAGSSIRIGKGAKISNDAVIIGPVVIEDGAIIGKATVGPYSHVMRGARIEDGAVVSGSILFEHSRVGASARVEDSIMDGFSEVGERARVESYSILGYKSQVGKEARMFSRSKLWPGVRISEGAVLEGEIQTPLTVELQKELDESRFWK
jgi:NDP-sugar pyrophosphorylase family protein